MIRYIIVIGLVFLLSISFPEMSVWVASGALLAVWVVWQFFPVFLAVLAAYGTYCLLLK